ncbi:hypothetical protein HYW83_04865 [Candidatus Peregrinibacteria bacterium]|nr:hypothetical protein [Candidatus Peregrinibacteria bacterium]
MLISAPPKIAKSEIQTIARSVAKPSLADSVKNWSDALLYSKCKTYGFNARVWLRKFAGLLPEVNRRQLYKRRGYASLHEFARKLAGMSDYTTDKILSIAAKLEDKPTLKEKFVAGEEGWSKIEKVAYVATKESDEFWAKKTSSLTQRALEVYVQEFRKQQSETAKLSGDAMPDGKNYRLGFTLKSDGSNNMPMLQGAPPLGDMPPVRLSFPVSMQLERELKLFKQKLEKERSQTLAWNEVMQELLRGYAAKGSGTGSAITSGKTTTITICPDCVKKETNEAAQMGAVSRHIPADVKKIVDERYNYWCAYPECRKPPDIYHHTRRFGLAQNHDPNFIVPLCSSHERLAHAGLINHEDKNPALWRILAEPDRREPKFRIDQKVNVYRDEKTATMAKKDC